MLGLWNIFSEWRNQWVNECSGWVSIVCNKAVLPLSWWRSLHRSVTLLLLSHRNYKVFPSTSCYQPRKLSREKQIDSVFKIIPWWNQHLLQQQSKAESASKRDCLLGGALLLYVMSQQTQTWINNTYVLCILSLLLYAIFSLWQELQGFPKLPELYV